jgi:hypothetical protein
MATGIGLISLPLAVGVDRGHPQWPDLSFIFFIFFFFAGSHRRGWWLPASVRQRWVAGGGGDGIWVVMVD